MNKLTVIYSILILGILVNIFWLFSESDKNEFVIGPVYALEQNDTQGYLEYNDKQTRIEFQYPEDWYINQLRPYMIVITPFFDHYLPSFTDYYFDSEDFTKLKSELQKRSETLDTLTLGIESRLGINKNSSTLNNLFLDGLSIPGEYEQIQPLTIDNHTAYKIIRPQVIHIALEVEDISSNQVFHILIFVQDTKNMNQLIKKETDKIISSIKVLDPFVIENVLSVGKKLVPPNELQNISIYTRDKYYNKTLPYTAVSIKITYPFGFELDIPNTISTNENGRFYYEWTIPANAVFGKYTISATTHKEDYSMSTNSIFFYVIDKKEKIPLRLEIETIDIISLDIYSKTFNIDFKLINPNTEKVTINQINYNVYYNNFKLLSGEYHSSSPSSKELIRDSQRLERNENSEDIWNIWNTIALEGKSLDLKINGTFSYNPYPDLIQIENKEEFNLQYPKQKR
jgi:LEA14-like dessication related protein